jgi:hypothetical protein
MYGIQNERGQWYAGKNEWTGYSSLAWSYFYYCDAGDKVNELIHLGHDVQIKKLA